jgi:twitching motility protein PilT
MPLQLTSIDDLHITVASPPAFRVRGHIQRADDYELLTPDDTRGLLYRVLSSEQQKQFELKRQLDFAYAIPGLARFRVNVYYQRESVGAAFRLIPTEIKTMEELRLPPVLHQLTALPRGLVLVTGPTGSGKSTTLASIIDEINRSRPEHILTVEDPIEFVHKHKKCIVNQREIGPDAMSFGEALKAALRQDPDIILVGEMRDLETISTALTAAETGHLVFGTLHTQSAPSTIDRIIDVFPPAQQEQVRIMIANSLQAVVTQALLPTADGAGRVAALEILLPDDAVRNLIRQAKIEQVYSVMQTGTARGMQTMEQALADLTIRRVVNVDVALERSSRPDQLTGILERSGFDVEQALQMQGGHHAPAAPQPAAPALRMAGS